MKIFSILSAEQLKNNIKNIFFRFHIPFIITIIISGLFLSLVHGIHSNQVEDNILRAIFSFIITFFLSVGIYLFNESRNSKKIYIYIPHILSIIFGILFYIGFNQNIDNFENFVFFTLTLAGIISFLFFAPYTNNILKDNVEHNIYYKYFYNISVVFLTSFILGFVLFILGFIGITTVFALFDLDRINNSKIISDWAIIALTIITPIFALANLPNKDSFTKNDFHENVFFSFLIKYIAIPFIYIYFIILYTYTIKVLSNFGDWPKGEVSWMVIGFSTFGYITYIYSYVFEEKNKFINVFRKTFPYVVIPQIFMLAYAIYLRIDQYDITTNRYFIVVFGLWLLIISTYYIFSKAKKLSVIVSSLTLFTIIISIGPWSVYNLPESRQYSILEVNLTEVGILKNGEIIPLKNYDDIDSKLGENIYSEIDYLCDFSNCNSIKQLFKIQYNELLKTDEEKWKKNKEENIIRYKKQIAENSTVDKKIVERNEENLKKELEKIYKGPSKYQIVNHITNFIKVERYYSDNNLIRSEIYFRIEGNKGAFPIDTTGYKSIYNIEDHRSDLSSNKFAYIDLENNFIELTHNGKTDRINTNSIIKQLEKTYKKGKRNYSKEELTFIVGGYKIVLQNISIKNPNYTGDDKVYTNATGYILIK